MIDRQALLADLKPLVVQLTDDLRTRLQEHAPSKALVDADHEAARKAGRTAQTLAAFTDDHLTQVAVAWVLATVFVRFVEDNGLCDEPWLSGPHRPQNRMSQARDRYTAWLRQHPHQSDRDYLLHVFAALGQLPGLQPLLGAGNTLVHRLGPTADGARLLREFWQQVEGKGDAAQLRHDFTDAAADTRFLGDLYQELSEAAQKKYALLQTPDFIEEFILDRTLEPALAEFGLAETRLIDPACGSGHFLLGAFARLFARWTKQEPGTPVQQRAKKALDAVAGVDLNPFAVAIARFRLLVAALKACNVTRLAEAYDFRPQVANGDSLLHGNPDLGSAREGRLFAEERAQFDHFFSSEDKELLRSIFDRAYQAVVGNPPYIVPNDAALRGMYRKRFKTSCTGKYHLSSPFTVVFMELARSQLDAHLPPGFVGLITDNAFMKRDYGKGLIEQYLNGRVELSHVVDLSWAHIPGHGTPTVILLGRPRAAQKQTVRAVLGIKGEPSTPSDPAKGLVWSAIVGQVDRPGSESDFVSCADMERERFAKHPWSIGGGGAAELKEQIEEAGEKTLGELAESVGITSFTLEDDVFLLPGSAAGRHRIAQEHLRPMLVGDEIRDWCCSPTQVAVFPYDGDLRPIELTSQLGAYRYLWLARTCLANNKMFGGKTKVEAGLKWWEFGRLTANKLRTPLSIAIAFVATHNHFVLDRGGKVFKQSAPVIKLPAGATEDDHLGLLGLLNSSVACFWMKQVFYPKSSAVGDVSTEKGKPEANRYEFASTGMQDFPVPRLSAIALAIARQLDHYAKERADTEAGVVVSRCADISSLGRRLADAEEQRNYLTERMIALQEELDWECYHLFRLADEGADPEIVNNDQACVAADDRPAFWPPSREGKAISTAVVTTYRKRRDLISRNPTIAIIESPVFKRLWLGRQGVFGHNSGDYSTKKIQALSAWLLNRMEDPKFWGQPRLLSTARFAEQLRADADFVQVANLYRGRDDYDFDDLVQELVTSEAVPFLPVLRYKPSGLRKRADWEATWALQRREDAGENVGPIPVPPKYTSADFTKSSYWSLRGKLDVPKERFVLYPFAERGDDTTPVFTWAGFDHAQQAESLAARYLERKDQDAATPDQLLPLLAGLRELLPWLLQWHNAPTADSPQGLGSAYHDFLTAELHALGKTEKDLVAWTPPARTRARTPRARATRQQGQDAEEP